MQRIPQSFPFPRFENKPLRSIGLVICALAFMAQGAKAFTHPGLLNNSGDLYRAKTSIYAGTEPWRSAWERLQNSWLPGVNGTYTASPVTTVTDTGSRSPSILSDSEAAYINAIEWYMTNNQTYANTAIAILNAWSSTCTTINGSNAQLAAGLDFVNMVNAAEIIRYSNAGWSAANITQFQNFLVNVVYPPCSPSGPDSWGACSNTMMMMIGVFCDNQTIYNQGYNNFISTNPSVACWTSLYDTSSAALGQPRDCGRDQGHGQLGVSIGLQAAEIALNSSGVNLFTYDNNLLLSACEYITKYNLGHGVPWDVSFVTTPYNISSQGRGTFWPIYALAQAGFTRSGISGSYTNQAVNAVGIECLTNQGGGLGTLLYTQASTSRPQPQYALLTTPGGYLMAGNNGASAITSSSPCIRNLETYQEFIQGNGYSAFKSVANGKYVTAHGTTSLTADSTTVGTAQEFKVIDMGNQNLCLVSAANGMMVAALGNGAMAASLSYSSTRYFAFGVYAVGSTVPAVVTNLDGNTYRMTNGNSGDVVDVTGASLNNDAAVEQYPYTGGTNQRWTFSNGGNGFYTVESVNSGLLLDVINASTSAGALIDQYAYDGGLNQFWVPQHVNYADGTGAYNLYSANAAGNLNLLDVPGAATGPVQLEQAAPNGGAAQQWSLSAP